MPGNSDDSFDFTKSPGGPEHTIGELTAYAIHEVENWDQGGHSSGQDEPRTGLPNIFPGQEGNIFDTVDFLLTDPIFDGL